MHYFLQCLWDPGIQKFCYYLPIQQDYYSKYQENADLQGFSTEQIVMIITVCRNSIKYDWHNYALESNG